MPGFSNNIHSSQDFIEFEEEDNIPLSKLFSLDTELPSNIATYSEIDDGLLTENLDCGGSRIVLQITWRRMETTILMLTI